MVKIANIIQDSIVDGPGLRTAVFVQGCPHGCNGCHNTGAHDFNGGVSMSADEIIERIRINPLCMGVTFTGGEPLCQAAELLPVARYCVKNNLPVAVYTGYTFEEILEASEPMQIELLNMTDVIIDGRFVLAERSLNLKFKGSKNQRVLDAKESLRLRRAVLTADQSWF